MAKPFRQDRDGRVRGFRAAKGSGLEFLGAGLGRTTIFVFSSFRLRLNAIANSPGQTPAFRRDSRKP